MQVIGLTGGIASGKSTVSSLFRALGAEVIDADLVARQVVEPGQPALAEIARRFPGVVGADGSLDRIQLGERVFGDAKERAALNALIHPRIREAVEHQLDELARRGVPFALYDAPLLIENRLHEGMQGVVLVWTPRDTQVQRLRARNGLSREQAEARIAAQLPLDDKRSYATWVIDNSGDLEATRAQVERVWQAIRQRQE